ncbi:hypothetical protein T552_02589 [Pneumocystis carinii B80]|uniref:Ribosome biogenesis protein YTM1 n=1 Tax=Pneumocystis carinii (strain B80) TaxID=1408658 RepID=A0A0W4ZFG7_PNEC8|nr:hypothetical protein T552_02589 [Pneumocystis carinii B80]KTW27097.1 hypothetical protein T552_02589 [Pneumocystis carinii B80]
MENQTKIRVIFVTKDKEIEVENTPIFVPLSLSRYGLNEVVNHLLEKEPPLNFAFLIDGEFLQGSLGEYLARKERTCETTLSIEYLRCILEPKYALSFVHSDWVSSVKSAESEEIVSGCYDGVARIWNDKGEVITETSVHEGPVKSVCWVEKGRFATSSMDQRIKIWEYKKKKSGKVICRCIIEMKGHDMSVESIAVNFETKRLLSSGADGNIGIWDIEEGENVIDEEKMNKKRRINESKNRIVTKKPICMIEGHSSSSSEIIFDSKDSTVGYSVGTDRCIKTWDLITFSNVDTRVTQQALLCICSIPSLSLLACGSSSQHILLHDPRISLKSTPVQTLKGHKNFVVSLSPCDRNNYALISGSYDSLVKIWDIRAPNGSLYSIARKSEKNDTKVFSIDWSNAFGIISGGEDHCLQIDQINDL